MFSTLEPDPEAKRTSLCMVETAVFKDTKVR
jgi:hypothetical protein